MEVAVGASLQQVLGDILGIAPEAVADDLSMHNNETWDSLKHMEVVVGIEENFGITLEAEEIVTITSVTEIKRVLSAKGIDL